MSNKNFTLTYDELLLLLKDAYRNGYSTYEMTAAGLEPYDDDGYARWVLLGMESNKILTSNKDKDIFFNELLNPSEPNKALKDAVAKYKMKPTAVEWLFEQISKSPYYYKLIEHIESKDTIRKPKNIFQQAKQMEDEQLFEYWNGGMQSTEEGGVSFDVYHNGDDNEKLHLSVVSDLLASTDMDTMCQQLQMEVNASETQKYYKSKEVQDLDNPTDVVDEYESMGNLEKMLDWLVALDIQHYKTESFSDYKPSGNSHFYLKGSPERFTSMEMIKIFHNQADGELMKRWNYAIADVMCKKNAQTLYTI